MVQKNNRKRAQTHALDKIPEKTKTAQELYKISTSDAVVLAALTLFSYIIHYAFEYGYLSYFGIPTAFISFDLPEMIPAVFFLVFAYFIFVFVLWPYIRLLLDVLPGFLKTVLILSPWLVIFVLSGFSWEIILFISVVILLIFGIDILKKRRGWMTAGKDYFRNIFVLFYLLLLALVSSFAFGRTAALTRSRFPVVDSSPRCVVVYTTAERYICKPLINDNAFEDTFKVYYFQENQNIELRNENIGPLQQHIVQK